MSFGSPGRPGSRPQGSMGSCCKHKGTMGNGSGGQKARKGTMGTGGGGQSRKGVMGRG